ncbi:hypothetical protein K501DRAFT_258892 [Backusella circina FSU 941]|nr:hypothetical protein K501DRAFT_258892 [Backusella circina FSU 941]
MTNQESLKIVTPIGMLGYGYSEALLYKGISMGATAIIVDSGSTDSGPQKLALGTTTCPIDAYKKDLKPLLDACWHHKVKVLISSAGGDGSNQHVDELCQIVRDYCIEKAYQLKLIRIYAEIDPRIVHDALDAGKISSCSSSPALVQDEIDKSPRIVAQMGMEPFIQAMETEPDFDVIISGRAYDPAPYAAFCYVNGFKNIGNIYHMGKVMECGALCCTPKSKEALATIWQDRFEITPLSDESKCTVDSLSAHTLYEKARPDFLQGPGGTLDLTSSSYQVSPTDPRSCQATGAKFIPSDPYTIKLEGAKITGYRSVFLGGVRDPILISQIDSFLEKIKQYIGAAFKNVEYDLHFHVYGKDGIMGPLERDTSIGKEVCIMGEVRATTQQNATNIASAARIGVVHGPYPDQKATSGNFAMPFTPLEVALGPVCEFNIYHCMEVDDPVIHFPWFSTIVGPDTNIADRNAAHGLLSLGKSEMDAQTKALSMAAKSIENGSTVKWQSNLGLKEDVTYLYQLARVIRSKNAGPFELTFDVIFNDMDALNKARDSGALTADNLAPLYNISVEKVVSCMFFEQAKAFKFTIPRWAPNGGFGETDVHASQQHVPLMFIEI